MSGTSLDGVDVALIETDGEGTAQFGPIGYRPYSDEEQDLLRAALSAGVSLRDRWARPGVLTEAEVRIACLDARTFRPLRTPEFLLSAFAAQEKL